MLTQILLVALRMVTLLLCACLAVLAIDYAIHHLHWSLCAVPAALAYFVLDALAN